MGTPKGSGTRVQLTLGTSGKVQPIKGSLELGVCAGGAQELRTELPSQGTNATAEGGVASAEVFGQGTGSRLASYCIWRVNGRFVGAV